MWEMKYPITVPTIDGNLGINCKDLEMGPLI